MSQGAEGRGHVRFFLASIAVAASLPICVNAATIAQRLVVMDKPDRRRKNHPQETPLVGGIAILLPLLVWLYGVLLNSVIGDAQSLLLLMLCAAGVGLVGFADDQTPITPLSRILALLVLFGVALVIRPGLIAPGLSVDYTFAHISKTIPPIQRASFASVTPSARCGQSTA